MSTFEIERLRQEYEEYIKDVRLAKANGNNALLKSSLLGASEALNKLASYYSGEAREKALADSRQMFNIAARIQVKENKSQPQGQQANFFGSNPLLNNDNNQSYGNNDAEQGQNDNIEGLLTFIKPEDIDVTFNDVIGLEKAKEAMQQYVIKPMKDPASYNYNYGNSKCIFLAGPPGTGKTTFAKAVAKEVGVPFAMVEVSGIVNCYVGETAKNIDKVFRFAREYAQRNNTKLILFLDEFEEMARSRGADDKASSAAVPALLRNLDGMSNSKDIIVLAASNYVELIDSALLDRFRQIVEVPLPNEEARRFLFKNKFKDVEPEYLQFLNFDEAAKASEGFSGREITNISYAVKYYISDCKAAHEPIDEKVQQVLLQKIEERKQSPRQ